MGEELVYVIVAETVTADSKDAWVISLGLLSIDEFEV